MERVYAYSKSRYDNKCANTAFNGVYPLLWHSDCISIMNQLIRSMQFSLFAIEDQSKKDYQNFIKSIIHNGKTAKFLDCRIRKYGRDTGMDLGSILKHLRDIETIAVGLCIEASKISSTRPLKTDDLSNIFTSMISDKDLKLESSASKCWESFFNLKSGINLIGKSLASAKGKSKNPDILFTEQELTERYVDLIFAITRLGLIMRNEIIYDIQSR